MVRITLKKKVKERKSTPAPSTKGDGRKRYVLSPMPEDKQLRKKIDFGAEGSSLAGSPKCKSALFPASPGRGMKMAQPGSEVNTATYEEGEERLAIALGSCLVAGDTPNHGKGETAQPEKMLHDGPVEVAVEEKSILEHGGSDAVARASPADQNSGDSLKAVVKIQDQPLSASPTDLGDPCGVQNALACVKVNLPQMDVETKSPFESAFVPYQKGCSRDVPSTSLPKQPKSDECTRFPEMAIKTNMLVESRVTPSSLGEARDALAFDHRKLKQRDDLTQLAALDSAEMLDAMAAQPLLAAGQPEKETPTGEPRSAMPMMIEPITMSQPITYIPPLEDFPPLERGRTSKLRDSFERRRGPEDVGPKGGRPEQPTCIPIATKAWGGGLGGSLRVPTVEPRHMQTSDIAPESTRKNNGQPSPTTSATVGSPSNNNPQLPSQVGNVEANPTGNRMPKSMADLVRESPNKDLHRPQTASRPSTSPEPKSKS